MNVKPCSCGHEACLDYIPFQGWFVCCPVAGGCGRRGCFRGSHAEAVVLWEAELQAFNAAMHSKPEPEPKPEPKPSMNMVFGGEWQSEDEIIYVEEVDGWKRCVARLFWDGKGKEEIRSNTARLMAASKELLRKLMEGRDLYNDGYTAASISEYFCSVGEIIDGLGVDVD